MPSIAKCEQIDTVLKENLGTCIGAVSEKEMEQIDKALLISLGIELPNMSEKSAAEIQALTMELNVYKEMYNELLEKMIRR